MDIDRMRARICKKCNQRQSDPGTCGDKWHIPNRINPQQARRWEMPEERENFIMELRQYIDEDMDDFLRHTMPTPGELGLEQQTDDAQDTVPITSIFQDNQD